MKKARLIIAISGVFMLLFSYGNMSANSVNADRSGTDQTTSQSVQAQTKPAQTTTKSTQTQTKPAQTTTKSTQTQTKPTQTTTKSTQTQSKQTTTKSTKPVSKPAQTKSNPVPKSTTPAAADKSKDAGTVRIGTQTWASANLSVITFRNGDSIPEAKTNKEWVAAGESGTPAWCYYNNDPANGKKYGRLYNWHAVNDPRGLAPAGWSLPSDADWTILASYLGGPGAAGNKMKSTSAWIEDNNGTNEAGFNGFPGGYRVENGTFLNIGSIATWWSSTESKTRAVDYYLSLSSSLDRSTSPKNRGESVRCLKK